ncbi:MAG: IMP dehydrogenase [Pseudomonadota bacterium]
MSEKLKLGLTFDDVLITPAYSNVLPKNVCLKTRFTKNITLNIPLVSAAMDTVTTSGTAIAMAQEGGIGIIHKNMTIEQQAAEVKKVKRFESGMVKYPITIEPQATIEQLRSITKEHHISGVPVVEGKQLVGIVTSRDIRFENDAKQKIANVMTPKERLVTVKENASKETILSLLQQHRIEKLLIINDDFQLRGMITVKDIQKAEAKPNAAKDEQRHLLVGAAIGVGAESEERAAALVKAGVDVIVVDTAHGHSQGVLDRVRWMKTHYPQCDIIGGNIATAEAAKALMDAGADGVKVGIGPGSICTTRAISGAGMPQITAIQSVASALAGTGIPLIADGGIRYSGDISKAIAAGAATVMIGSLFAGTEEAPGEVELYKGRSYKSYRGMGSIAAMSQKHGSSDRYFQEASEEQSIKALIPEGVEGRVPYKGSLLSVLQQLLGGLRSGMGYAGCPTIDDMMRKTVFVQVTHAALAEGHVHDVTITREAPNYQL